MVLMLQRRDATGSYFTQFRTMARVVTCSVDNLKLFSRCSLHKSYFIEQKLSIHLKVMVFNSNGEIKIVKLIIIFMEESRSAFKLLTGTPIGKRPLGRPMIRWEGMLE